MNQQVEPERGREMEHNNTKPEGGRGTKDQDVEQREGMPTDCVECGHGKDAHYMNSGIREICLDAGCNCTLYQKQKSERDKAMMVYPTSQRTDEAGKQFRYGFNAGYDAGYDASRWVPVETPPKEITYYVIRNQQGSVDLGYWSNGRFLDHEGDEFYDATHWMPIPPYESPDR